MQPCPEALPAIAIDTASATTITRHDAKHRADHPPLPPRELARGGDRLRVPGGERH